MEQDTSYPDPAQLEKYADEPMPFHEVTTGDLQITPRGGLVAAFDDVVYRYRPADIMIEDEPNEYVPAQRLSYGDIGHAEAWSRAMDVEVQEDFVCTIEFVTDEEGEAHQYEAYWILDTVTIHN